MSVTNRPNDTWVIDFHGLSVEEAMDFEAPFKHAKEMVLPYRMGVRMKQRREKRWLFGASGAALRKRMMSIHRYICTVRVAKHRLFVWRTSNILPDTRLVAICRDDETTFGILHSKLHEVWSLATGGWHGVGNDPQYTPTLGFKTFPFPQGLTPNIPAADYAADPRAIKIAAAAKDLNQKRENWLNPPDLVVIEPEVVAGYPDRILPKDEDAAKILKTRTLTNLYNARPAWLYNAHKVLDDAVAEAYNWGDDYRAGLSTDDEILSRLFALNQERAGN